MEGEHEMDKIYKKNGQPINGNELPRRQKESNRI